MTPQMIDDYKRTWLPHCIYRVELHIDLRRNGVQFCKDNFLNTAWHEVRWSQPYYHYYYFEYEEHAREFAKAFPDHTIIGF
jgi:hypothetical protein